MNMKKSLIAFAIVSVTSGSAFAQTITGDAKASDVFVISDVSDLEVSISPEAGLTVEQANTGNSNLGNFIVRGSGNLAVAFNEATAPIPGDPLCAKLQGENDPTNTFTVCLSATPGSYSGFAGQLNINGKSYINLQNVTDGGGNALGYFSSAVGQAGGVVRADTFPVVLDAISYVN